MATGDSISVGSGFLNPKNRLAGRIPLKAGQMYTEAASPFVEGKDLTISATLKPTKGDGVVVAQGGSLVGYSLYLRDGKLILGVRTQSQLQELVSDAKVVGRAVKVLAKVGADGSRSLEVDGQTVMSKGPVLSPQPKMGLSAGSDQSHDTGRYKDENYQGEIRELVLEVR